MARSMLAAAANVRILGKSPLSVYLRLNERIWRQLGPSVTASPAARAYGSFLHTLVCLRAGRRQYFGTFFLRNRPELDLIKRLVMLEPIGAPLRIAVVACSNGAEVYSILWTIRSARPDLQLATIAADISPSVVALAQKGSYSIEAPELVGSEIFDRVTPGEMDAMFDVEGGRASVKPSLRKGIRWQVADAGDPGLVSAWGLQDIVVANNFLCHMEPGDAERCLRNVARLVRPGGHLFVSGVDLDVRTKVALECGWEPVPELLEAIHDGDRVVREDWPFKWSGLEPLNKNRPDWRLRYASVFRVGRSHGRD